MPDINISVRGKIAVLTERAAIVCDNSDFVAVFAFDDEWAAYETKTARFRTGRTYTDVVFEGDRCPVPRIQSVSVVQVGVFAGDLHTTTPALVPCLPSILGGDGSPADPAPDVYDQLMEKLNGLEDVSDEQIAAAVEDYLAENPVAGTMTVNITYNSETGKYSADKTFAEVKAAFDKGQVIQAAYWDGIYANLGLYENAYFIFAKVEQWDLGSEIPLESIVLWSGEDGRVDYKRVDLYDYVGRNTMVVRFERDKDNPGTDTQWNLVADKTFDEVGTELSFNNGEKTVRGVLFDDVFRVDFSCGGHVGSQSVWFLGYHPDGAFLLAVMKSDGTSFATILPFAGGESGDYAPKVLTVNIANDSDGNLKADHTPAEIKAAVDAGGTVVALWNELVLPVLAYYDNLAVFSISANVKGTPTMAVILVKEDGSASIESAEILTVELAEKLLELIGEKLASPLPLGITGATVGQTIKITEVDGDGRPTGWEAVDAVSSGEEWEKIGEWIWPEAGNVTSGNSASSFDVSGCNEVVAYLNQTVSNSDSASVLLTVNGVNLDYFPARTTPQNSYCKIETKPRITVQRMTSNYSYHGWGGVTMSTPNVSNEDWSYLGDELKTVTFSMSASAYSPVSGTIEVWGRKQK